MNVTRRAVVWAWYGSHLGPTVREPSGIQDATELSGLARTDELIITTARAKGVPQLLAREALHRRRRVVLLEFIRAEAHGWRRPYDRLLGQLLRRAAYRLHVLSTAEVQRYRSRYKLAGSVVFFAPWPLRLLGEDPKPPRHMSGARRVVASGRAACDWATLFAAARLADPPWELTVICGAADATSVAGLNDISATVLVDVSPEDHDAAVAQANVYVLSLSESHASSGQIRLMTAIHLAVPVVATQVEGLIDYLSDPRVAVVIPPEDPTAMVAAVEALLQDPQRRTAAALAAQEAVADRTYDRYFQRLREAIFGDPATQPGPAGASG
jgi:hypothetical protein